MKKQTLSSMPKGRTPLQELVQDVGISVVKCGFSFVPLAVLVFDLGQIAVRFANQEQTSKLLDAISSEIDGLGATRVGVLDELRKSEFYQAAVCDALLKVRHPRPDEFVESVGRACVRLAATEDLNDSFRARLLKAMDVMESEHLSMLDVHWKYWREGGDGMSASEALTELAIKAVGEEYYKQCVLELVQLGCLVDGDGGTWGDQYIEAYQLSEFGRRLRSLYCK